MKKIPDIFHKKPLTYSFELFPPKTDKGYDNLKQTLEGLCRLEPDFFSCTYGAGGGSRDKTLDIVELIEKHYKQTAMAHLTCVLHTKDEIKSIVSDIKSRGVQNILALRGDPPKEFPEWKPTAENFKYSSELVEAIRQHFSAYFGIGVAGFPEGHVLCPDREQDVRYLKLKIDAGADFIITQLFFNNQDYFDYVKRLRHLGINARVIPGILPIMDYNGLVRFCGICGATVTEEVKKIFEPIAADPEATRHAGIEFCIRQCKELLKGGAPGLHFYTLNKIHPIDEVLKAVRI